jgi:hypothetical protein
MNKQIFAALALSTALFTGGALAEGMSATAPTSGGMMAPPSGGMATPHKPKPKPTHTNAMAPAGNAMAPANTMAPSNTNTMGTH